MDMFIGLIALPTLVGIFAGEPSLASDQPRCEALLTAAVQKTTTEDRHLSLQQAQLVCKSDVQRKALADALKSAVELDTIDCRQFLATLRHDTTLGVGSRLHPLAHAQSICRDTPLNAHLEALITDTIASYVNPVFEPTLTELRKKCRLSDLLALQLGPPDTQDLAILCATGSDPLESDIRVLEYSAGVIKTAFVLHSEGASPGFPDEFKSIQGKDLNQDGFPEFLVRTDAGGSSRTSQTITVFRWKDHSAQALFSGPLERVEDLNGDGIYELVVSEDSPEDEPEACNACKESWWKAYEWRRGKYQVAEERRVLAKVQRWIRDGRVVLLADLEKRHKRGEGLEQWEERRRTRLREVLSNEQHSEERSLDSGSRSRSPSPMQVDPNYFPLAVGMVWEWRMRGNAPGFKDPNRWEVIDQTVGEAGARTYRIHRTGPRAEVFGNAFTDITIRADGIVQGAHSRFLRLPLRPGDRWTDGESTVEVVALREAVRTPAGVFRHCLRVIERTPSIKHSPFAALFEDYAPEIGAVRSGFLGPPLDTSEELVRFTVRKAVHVEENQPEKEGAGEGDAEQR